MTCATVPERHIVPAVCCGNEAMPPSTGVGGEVMVEQSAAGCIPFVTHWPGGEPLAPRLSP